jgi:hypothetical protein
MSEIDPFELEFEGHDGLEEEFRELDPQPQESQEPGSAIPEWALQYPPNSRVRGMVAEQVSLIDEDSFDPSRAFLRAVAEFRLTLLQDFHTYVGIILMQEDNPAVAIHKTRKSLKDEIVVDLQTDAPDLIPLVEGYVEEIGDAFSEWSTMRVD